jgi:hypothetical protein
VTIVRVTVFVRIARFEGGDPANVDEAISRVRSMMDEGSTPPGLEGARRSMMLVDRQSGSGLGVTSSTRQRACAAATRR